MLSAPRLQSVQVKIYWTTRGIFPAVSHLTTHSLARMDSSPHWAVRYVGGEFIIKFFVNIWLLARVPLHMGLPRISYPERQS